MKFVERMFRKKKVRTIRGRGKSWPSLNKAKKREDSYLKLEIDPLDESLGEVIDFCEDLEISRPVKKNESKDFVGPYEFN